MLKLLLLLLPSLPLFFTSAPAPTSEAAAADVCIALTDCSVSMLQPSLTIVTTCCNAAECVVFWGFAQCGPNDCCGMQAC